MEKKEAKEKAAVKFFPRVRTPCGHGAVPSSLSKFPVPILLLHELRLYTVVGDQPRLRSTCWP